MSTIPREIEGDIRRAVRLEWWTLGWQLSIVAVMWLVMGSSQAMKSAWTEDLLGLIPAGVFLVAVRFERKNPSRRFPYGFERVNSLAFLAASTALFGMGAYLIYDSGMKLMAAEHPTIGPITVFGHTIWIGWLMIAALAYSIVPPVVLGRLKQPVAARIHDKVLHTDALMQKADWTTGAAAIVGILGVGLGFWWADSLAAALIACDIIHDGLRASRAAIAELADGTPRALGSNRIAPDAEKLQESLSRRFPDAQVRLRETGRYISAEIVGAPPPAERMSRRDLWPGGPDTAWRLVDASFAAVPPRDAA